MVGIYSVAVLSTAWNLFSDDVSTDSLMTLGTNFDTDVKISVVNVSKFYYLEIYWKLSLITFFHTFGTAVFPEQL